MGRPESVVGGQSHPSPEVPERRCPMSEKIKPYHLSRKAVLYVRQSSAYQVTHNQESRVLQYAMRNRLEALGFREIEVVDEDLGRSAAGTVTRSGFERMVAAVCLGEVGAVAAREVSRFARNSREWQHLVEVCRVVDTLLIDQEMVYATPVRSAKTAPAAPFSSCRCSTRAIRERGSTASGSSCVGTARHDRHFRPGAKSSPSCDATSQARPAAGG